MCAMYNKEDQWLIRQIQARFRGWKVEEILMKDQRSTVFQAANGNQRAQIHAVRFDRTREYAIYGKTARSHWRTWARDYQIWINKLRWMKDAGELALPVDAAEVSSVLGGGSKTVLALQPEMTPLKTRAHRQMQPSEMAQMFRALCAAVDQCRAERIPHGRLVISNVMCRPDGGYCLGGMMALEILDVFNQPMPHESSELQQIALLVASLMPENKLGDTSDEPGSTTTLKQLIRRASLGEKGLTLRQVINELDAILGTMRREVERKDVVAGFRDMTDLFRTDNGGRGAGIAAEMPSGDLEMTIGVRANGKAPVWAQKDAPVADGQDLDATIGVRNARSAILERRKASETTQTIEDLEQTINIVHK